MSPYLVTAWQWPIGYYHQATKNEMENQTWSIILLFHQCRPSWQTYNWLYLCWAKQRKAHHVKNLNATMPLSSNYWIWWWWNGNRWYHQQNKAICVQCYGTRNVSFCNTSWKRHTICTRWDATTFRQQSVPPAPSARLFSIRSCMCLLNWRGWIQEVCWLLCAIESSHRWKHYRKSYFYKTKVLDNESLML